MLRFIVYILFTASVPSLGAPLALEHCQISPRTLRTIELFLASKNGPEVWPGFPQKALRVVLSDGQFDRRALLVGFGREELQSFGAGLTQCSENKDVYWAKGRSIPARTDSHILQCASREKHLKDYRCDYFPELQALFEKTGLEIHLYHAPDPTAQEMALQFIGQALSPSEEDDLSAATIFHEYFHGHQDLIQSHRVERLVNPEHVADYYEECVSSETWKTLIDKEREIWVSLLKRAGRPNFTSFARDQIQRIFKLRGQVPTEWQACMNAYRGWERMEGMAEYVGYAPILRYKASPLESVGATHEAVLKLNNRYYVTGLLIGLVLDELGHDPLWKIRVTEGQYPETVAREFIGSK